MANSKVELASGEVLIDISQDTVTPQTLALGETAHDASGSPIVGEYVGGETSWLYAGTEEPTGGNNGDLWVDYGDVIPAGWTMGYSEVTPTVNNTPIDFVFNGFNVDPDYSVFICFTDENRPLSSSSLTRIMVGRLSFGGYFSTETIFQNVTSPGVAQGTAQLADTEFEISVDKSGEKPITTVTVNYVNTRKFVVGKKYKAIMVGRVGS